jgi:hypothetical protein
LVLERNKPAGDALVNLLARLGTHFYWQYAHEFQTTN